MTVHEKKEEVTMTDRGGRYLVWDIRKSLLSLSVKELSHIANTVGQVQDKDQSELDEGDHEGCFEYISAFMYSKSLLESEDGGMVELLVLKDNVDAVIQTLNVTTLFYPSDNIEPCNTLTIPPSI